MTGASDEWRSLCDAFSRFARRIDQSSTVNINTVSMRSLAREVAQQYFRQARPVLQEVGLDPLLEPMTSAFQGLLELSSRSNATNSYKKHIRSIRKAIPKITSSIELQQSAPRNAGNTTEEDQRIIETLHGLVPCAALSYKQAVIDIADSSRLSFRGPALELRECLRETLDHLAPDENVVGAEGYAQEKGRHGPTMKQKVRFILRARGHSKSSTDAPERTTITVDEMVGDLTRSVYERSSAASHVAMERKVVIQIRRYVAAVLHHILEL